MSQILWAVEYGRAPSRQLSLAGLQMAAPDRPTGETPLSLVEIREAVRKLKGGKAAGICNISAEMLKAGGEAMIRELHAILSAMWHSCATPHDWKRALIVPI